MTSELSQTKLEPRVTAYRSERRVLRDDESTQSQSPAAEVATTRIELEYGVANGSYWRRVLVAVIAASCLLAVLLRSIELLVSVLVPSTFALVELGAILLVVITLALVLVRVFGGLRNNHQPRRADKLSTRIEDATALEQHAPIKQIEHE